MSLKYSNIIKSYHLKTDQIQESVLSLIHHYDYDYQILRLFTSCASCAEFPPLRYKEKKYKYLMNQTKPQMSGHRADAFHILH